MLLVSGWRGTMISQTEFSGYGNFGVCTFVHKQAFEKALEWLSSGDARLKIEPWDPEILYDPWKRSGIGQCARRLQEREKERGDIYCLGWNPLKNAECIRSMAQLSFILRQVGEEPFPIPEWLGLSMSISSHPNGYAMGADFTDATWDVIESGSFSETVLSSINRDIRCWFEERVNYPVEGQYGSLFRGLDGPTLQIYQPSSNGVWISGSRKCGAGSHQLTDHNTDTPDDAMGHVIGLCTVLKHCRECAAGIHGVR
jgi:hypothetical protein